VNKKVKNMYSKFDYIKMNPQYYFLFFLLDY